jgi:hypothetical protein
MGHTKGHLWTPEEDEQILDRLAKGLSAAQIAAELDGPTRNAVIGRIMRAKALRDHGFAYKAGEQLRTRIEAKANVIEDVVATLPQAGKILLNLRDGECKWPVAYDPDAVGGWWFCAKRAMPGRAYCQHHTKVKLRGQGDV